MNEGPSLPNVSHQASALPNPPQSLLQRLLSASPYQKTPQQPYWPYIFLYLFACFGGGNFLSDEIERNPVDKAGRSGAVLPEADWGSHP